MEAVDPAAGEAADHGAVDADVLQVVAGVLLDESDRALRAEGVDAALDEGRGLPLVPGDDVRRLRLEPVVELRAQRLVRDEGLPRALDLIADPHHQVGSIAAEV